MSFANTPIPAAAEAAGMTNLVFADDFDSYDTIDVSGEGKPGYLWYTDRPYNCPPLVKEKEYSIKDSVLTLGVEARGCLAHLSSYSKAGDTGFLMQYGYAEIRMRIKMPDENYKKAWPAFWGMSKRDWMGQRWDNCGELDIIEMVPIHNKKMPIYTGTLHEHHRIRDEEGKYVKTIYASNLVNSTGYNDYFDYIDEEWHTYAALWEPGHVAWYWDNKLMHSARYNGIDLPQYFYRDSPVPLPRLEWRDPKFAGRTWKGAHKVMENDPQVMTIGARSDWPAEIDWVRIWQK